MKRRKTIIRRILLWSGLLAALVVGGVASTGIYLYHTIETEGRYFDSHGVRLHYLEEGEGSPVILLHGFGTNAASNWIVTRVFSRLAENHRVVALDLRGHGRSGKPHDPNQYGMEMVRDIPRLMDHLGIAQAHIVGYSLGGFLALKFAAGYPHRTLSVVPCASGWPESAEKDLAFLKKLGVVLDEEANLILLLERLQPPDEGHSEARLLTVNFAMSSLNDLTALGALLESADDLMITREEVQHIRVPVLAIVGERDPFKKFAEDMKNALSGTELVVLEDGDHFTTITKPEFTATLEAFLQAPPEQRINEGR
ncbi:MAG: alpha/beta hydrolase [Candidatus Hydrogenedentes bacterium]|nr:alpha/beta hydrolase [Candidatus Hydrogenedentota bacterium]